MKVARLLLILTCLSLVSASLIAQFSPRKDYVWARDVAGATMTLDGKMSESVWTKADSIVIRYGQYDGTPGGGWKIMNGSGDVNDPQNVVVKFLTDKAHNMLYISIVAKDSSVGGSGWENSDGVLAGIYDRAHLGSNFSAPQKEIFLMWGMDSASSAVGGLPAKGGDLPNGGIVHYATTVQGTSNSDTTGAGARVADTSWTMELVVSLDSLGYNANSLTTDVVDMSICIWDADWPVSSASHIATKAWWCHEWGNDGGAMAGRVLMRSDVNVNTSVLPAYGPDMTIKNGANFPNVVVDGSLSDSIWNYVPSLDLQYGNATLRATYPKEGRSGQWVTKYNSLNGVIDPGVAQVKMFFKGDTLYVGADISDQSILTRVSDDFFDGLQISMNIPVDTLRDGGNHQMAAKRFGVAPDSAVRGGALAFWDAMTGLANTPGFRYGAKLKGISVLNSTSVVSTGYTIEMAFDLTKFGYTAASLNKTVAIGVDYHDYDRTPTDTSAYHDWWFREWPWAATPAFAVLNNSSLLTPTGVANVANVPREFIVYHNYPNPFNPATTVQYSLPDIGNVKIRVYDLLGRLVGLQELVGQTSGIHQYIFDASKLASGVYYYNVEYVSARGDFRRMSPTEKMLLLK